MASSIKNNSLDLALTADIRSPSPVGQLSDLASSVERAVIPIVVQPPPANQESFSKRISQLFDGPPIEFECELAGSSGLTKRVSEAVARNFTNPGNFFDGQIEFGNSAEKSAGHKRKDPFSETGKSSKKEENSAPSSEIRIKHIGLNGFNEKTFDIWRNWRIGKKYEGEVSVLDLISLCRGCQFITEERGLFTWALTQLLLHPDLQVGDAQIILVEFVKDAEEEVEKLINTLQLPFSLRNKIIEKFAHAGHLPSQIEFLFSFLNRGVGAPQGMGVEKIQEWLKRAALEKDHTGSQIELLWRIKHNYFNADATLTEQLMNQLRKKGEKGDEDAINFLIYTRDLISTEEEVLWFEKLSDKHPEDSSHYFKLAERYLKMKDFKKANEWLAKGMQFDSKYTHDDMLLFSLGKAYEKESHESFISSEIAKKQAFACYQKVLEQAEYVSKEEKHLADLDIYYCKIADCYRKGIGVEIDLKKALNFYKKAKKVFEGSILYEGKELTEDCEHAHDIYRGIAETYFAMSIAAFREGISKTAEYISSEEQSKHLSSLEQMAQISSSAANNFSKDIALTRLKKGKELFEKGKGPIGTMCYANSKSNFISMFINNRLERLAKDLEAKGEYEKELQEMYQQVLQKIKDDLKKLQQTSPLDQSSILEHKESLEQLKNLGAQGVDEVLNPLQEMTGKWEATGQ